MFPLLVEIIMASTILLGAFFVGRESVKWTTVKEPEPGPPPSDEEMAATESEVIDALSDLHLDEDTYAALKSRIHTVAQLKATVATISSESCQVALEQLFPLAIEYVRNSHTDAVAGKTAEHVDELAKAIIIAQFSSPKGVVHPAFASIAMYIKATGKDAWPQFAEGMFACMREHNAANGTDAWDMIEPTQKGMIRIKRVTFLDKAFDGLPHFDDKQHQHTREEKICEIDPTRTPEELEFWSSVAQANMDWFVNDSHPKYTSLCGGDLLTWTSFFAKVNAKRPAQDHHTAPANTSLKPAVKVDDEIVEQEVPLTLDHKSNS